MSSSPVICDADPVAAGGGAGGATAGAAVTVSGAGGASSGAASCVHAIWNISATKKKDFLRD